MSNLNPTSTPTPTVLLVHGAFADSSSWADVVERLQAAGVPVVAVPNPLRGLAHDAAYVADRIAQIHGPVIAVGHSYGGAVITNAAADAPNVVGLVYVAAFAPDEGETLLGIEGDSRDSVLNEVLVELRYPDGPGGEQSIEYAIAADRFHQAFAADLPASHAAVLAATQRPAARACFTEPTAAVAWRSRSSWAVVPTEDYAAGSDVLRSMAERAGADVVAVPGSHAIAVSQPQVVTDQILKALAAQG